MTDSSAPDPEIKLDKTEQMFHAGMKATMLARQISFEDALAELRADGDAYLAPKLDRIAAFHEQQVSRIEKMEDPRSLDDRSSPPWYEGPGPASKRWNALRTYLLDDKGWGSDAVDSIDKSSSKVLSQFCNPSTRSFCSKGLVVGYVQSGKTANFTAVMAKAADEGYKLFIILAGLTNSLREQTQERMFDDLTRRDLQNWRTWTNMDSDFEPSTFDASDLLDAREEVRHLIVVKKNHRRLEKLIKELREAQHVLKRTPTVIIDDECDQASVNASGTPDDPNTINRLTRELIETIPRVTYVGYTATPFANVLIDPGYPTDLYPGDFIIALPKPDPYFGAEEIFGRDALLGEADPDGLGELDMIRLINEEEAASLRPARADDRFQFMPSMTASLRKAILYYLIATGIRQVRGQVGHSSMLIHTTMYSQTHLNTQLPVQELLEEVSLALENGQESVLAEMQSLFEHERARVQPENFSNESCSWEEVAAELPDVVRATEIAVENGISDNRVDYPEGESKNVIVIGGNILARGLTLEGLIVSFFLRTSSQYDTLMQMGRWFGYRFGWEDLPRIWMTPSMKGYFKDMAVVEAEIRRDISRYDESGITPTNFATRIRTHPTMRVTARNKMLSAEKVSLSFSGSSKQTTKFYLDNQDWLDANWSAASELVDVRLRGSDVFISDARNGSSKVLRSVPSGAVLQFLKRYEIHEDHPDIQTVFLIEYIQKQIHATSALTEWNVGIVGAQGNPVSERELGHLGNVMTVRRTRLSGTPDHSADVGALLTKADASLDYPDATPDNWGNIFAVRSSGPPLLLLYPIHHDSRPRRSGSRDDLAAPVDVLGIGLLFPDAPSRSAAEYISVQLDRAEEGEIPEYNPETDE